MLFFGKNPRLREVIGNIRVAKVSCFLLSCIKTYFHNKRFLINSCLRFESESCWKSDMVYYLTLPLKPGSHDLRWYVMARLCAKIALLIESRTSQQVSACVKFSTELYANLNLRRGVRNKVLNREASPRGSTPHLFIHHFGRKLSYPFNFVYLPFTNGTPFKYLV